MIANSVQIVILVSVQLTITSRSVDPEIDVGQLEVDKVVHFLRNAIVVKSSERNGQNEGELDNFKLFVNFPLFLACWAWVRVNLLDAEVIFNQLS